MIREKKPKPRAFDYLHISRTFLVLTATHPRRVLEIAEIFRQCDAKEAAHDLVELVYREHPDMAGG
jgi:hypothetical protein